MAKQWLKPGTSSSRAREQHELLRLRRCATFRYDHPIADMRGQSTHRPLRRIGGNASSNGAPLKCLFVNVTR
jgi:hypothetical protein